MKKMRVLLPMLLMVLCLLSPVDAYSTAAENPIEAEEGVVYIYTAEQLAAIYTDSAGKQYVLGADITLPHGWAPKDAGEAASLSQAFKGSLDGRGHSITGLKLDVTTGGAHGLFGRLEGAVISNLVLTDARIQIGGFEGHELVAGLLAGEAVGGAISNVTIVGGNISATGSGLESAVIGGLIGKGDGTRLENICAAVHIKLEFGEAVGGLAGYLNNCMVENSAASVQIQTKAEAAGGIAGVATDTSFYESGTEAGAVNGKSAAGGFAGRVQGTGRILDCYSHADVAGGFAGGFAGQITGSELTANANHALEVARCRATGKTHSSQDGIAGGFVGTGRYVLVSDSSAYGEVRSCAGAGGFVGRLSDSSRVIYAYAKGNVYLGCGVACTEPASMAGIAGGFVGELTNFACVELSYATGTVVAEGGFDAAVGGFAGYISASGAPNTITHCLSFAPWVVGDGYVHRFAGHASHDGVNGCYAHLGSMVVNGDSLAHVLPSAFGPDGADMSLAQVEDVIKRLGWRRDVTCLPLRDGSSD